MVKKPLFWTLTILLVLIAAFVLTVTVVLPVFDKNPLPEAMPKAAIKNDNPAKKSEKGENTPAKGEKGDKNGKKRDVKVQNIIQKKEEPVTGSREDIQAYYEVKKNESILKAQYALSTEDSVYLVLDLVNKTAILEMKGIPLHESVLESVVISNSIKMFHSDALIKWISQPFTLKNSISSIERVQFLVKIAPKDTIEANKAEAIPAPRKTDDVFIVMNFDRNLQLVIQQSEISEGIDKARIDSLKAGLNKSELSKSLKALTSMKREAVTPKIVITMPKKDAITLFRSLPQKLKMVLKI